MVGGLGGSGEPVGRCSCGGRRSGCFGGTRGCGAPGMVRDDGPGPTRGERAVRGGQSMAEGLWVDGGANSLPWSLPVFSPL